MFRGYSGQFPRDKAPSTGQLEFPLRIISENVDQIGPLKKYYKIKRNSFKHSIYKRFLLIVNLKIIVKLRGFLTCAKRKVGAQI
jgi:hypothetical protein